MAGRATARTIKKWLKTGAVLTVDSSSLADLSADAAVDHLSGDTMVRSMMADVTAGIGADQVVDGTIAAIGKITGKGVGIALIDSGVSNHQALKGHIAASFDFTGPNGTGGDDARVTARTWRGSSAARAATSAAWRRARGSSA